MRKFLYPISVTFLLTICCCTNGGKQSSKSVPVDNSPAKKEVMDLMFQEELRENVNTALTLHKNRATNFYKKECKRKIANIKNESGGLALAVKQDLAGALYCLDSKMGDDFVYDISAKKKKYNKELKNALSKINVKTDYIQNVCDSLINNWDLNYKSHRTVSNVFLQSLDCKTKKESIALIKDFVSNHAPETKPDVSNLKKIQENRWYSYDLNSNRKFLIKRDSNKVSVHLYPK